MRFFHPLIAALLLSCCAGAALADAFAEVRLTHITVGIDEQVLFDFDSTFDMSVHATRGTSPPFNWNTDTPYQFTSRELAVGETFYVDVNYTIALRDDGGPSPIGGWSEPIGFPRGFSCFCEAGYASVWTNFPNDRKPGVDVTFQEMRFNSGDNVPSNMTFSGMLRGTYTVTDPLTPFPAGELVVFATVYAQTTPVPEPATGWLLFGGLGLLGMLRWRRPHPL